jgi:hypothetical protein
MVSPIVIIFNIIRYLVANGSDLAITSNNGGTAFHLACQHGKLEGSFLELEATIRVQFRGLKGSGTGN